MRLRGPLRRLLSQFDLAFEIHMGRYTDGAGEESQVSGVRSMFVP